MEVMKCKGCPKYAPIATPGHGVCMSPMSYFPTCSEDTCHFFNGLSDELTCGDCDRLNNDTACFTCEAKDSAMHGDHLCSGFIDRREETIMNIFYEWFLTDQLSRARIDELYDRTKDFKLPWEDYEE